jgi:flagellar basal body L-ring protein FlgH
MRNRTARQFLWLALLLAGALAGGCAFGGANQPTQVAPQENEAQQQAAQLRQRRLKPPINTSRNLYEGSLWRGASSWGNLLRDHRARYRGDLLTVVEMQKIIKVPEVKPEQQAGQPQQPEQAAAAQPQEAIDPILAFLREQEKKREEIDKEQNEILRSIDSVEVEVVRVLSNGNMMVRGVHPPIFRDQNRVKYIVTLSGLVRPSDVDENNNMLSTKLSKAEYKVHRLVRRADLPLGSVARAAGRPKEGALLDRLTDFVTGPGTGSRSTQVSPK